MLKLIERLKLTSKIKKEIQGLKNLQANLKTNF